MAAKFLKKISTKFVGLETVKLEAVAVANPESPVPVMRVYGRISAVETGTGQFGPWLKFKGEHECINLITGEVYRSAILLLPEMASMIISGIVDTAKAVDSAAVAEYGLDLNVSFYDNPNKTGTKFIFGASPLIEASEEDVLSKMGKMLGKAPLLLPNAAKEDKEVIKEESTPKAKKK
jgi:hypothetical protein